MNLAANELIKILEDKIVDYGGKKSSKKNKVEMSEEQHQDRKMQETLFKERFFPEAKSVNFIKREDGQFQVEINEKIKSTEKNQSKVFLKNKLLKNKN